MGLLERQNTNVEALFGRVQAAGAVNPAWFLGRCVRCGDEIADQGKLCCLCTEEVRKLDVERHNVNWWDVYASQVGKGVTRGTTKVIKKKPPPQLPPIK